MHPGRHWEYSIEEYVRLEAHSNLKHEFVNGQIYAMGGGTPEHARLAAQIGFRLSSQLLGRRCNVYSSDARVRVVATGLDTYPDLSVVCGKAELDREDPLAITNPTLLVEVTSPSSEKYDRGDKLDQYQQIPSLCEVVIVAYQEPRIDVWRRGADAGWTITSAVAGGQVELTSIGCRLDVDEVYRDPLA